MDPLWWLIDRLAQWHARRGVGVVLMRTGKRGKGLRLEGYNLDWRGVKAMATNVAEIADEHAKRRDNVIAFGGRVKKPKAQHREL